MGIQSAGAGRAPALADGRAQPWREKFWGRRYQAIPISDEEAAQVERLRYVLAHGCKEGLVERLRDWPGVSAVRALLEDEPLEGYWFDCTREHRARRQGKAFERWSSRPLTQYISSPSPAGRISRPRSTGGGLRRWSTTSSATGGTQDSLPVGGQPLPGRIRTYRVTTKSFRISLLHPSSLPRLGLARGTYRHLSEAPSCESGGLAQAEQRAQPVAGPRVQGGPVG
jgi:hypothetical protein